MRVRVRAILVATLLLVAGRAAEAAPPTNAPRTPSSAADRKDFDVRAAHLEIGRRIPEIIAALAATPGTSVATFGLTQSEFLDGLLGILGPEGRAVSVHRVFGSYLAERESSARRGGRLESIFAADGDAHLEPGSVALVVAQEIDGFYLREEELWRQAWSALQPGGRLVLIRFPPSASKSGPSPPASAQAKPPASGFAERLHANRAAVRMEKAGFRWLESPKVLTHWILEVYRRVDIPAPSEVGGMPPP